MDRAAGGARLTVYAGRLDTRGLRVGDSVCVQGACLTVVGKRGQRLRFDVSDETLACTAGLDRAGEVNVERSLALGEELGGHLVTGHVDAVAKVVEVRRAGASKRVRIQVPARLAKYVARKGSVAVDGVSLTVNAVNGARFEANLIPHTLAVTTLARLARGAEVNIEVDLLARYAARILARG